ncbi:MAG: DUF4136 domain-containing protein [Bacteroides sp.]|nr:DUF4136 domain-containing protein [Bacteroides sp.]
MKKIISGILLSIFMLLFAVNLQAQVTSYVDESADFSTYKTYSFLGWQQDSDSLLPDIDKERLQKAFKSEFDARNLSYVQSGGDMSVSLYIFLEIKEDSLSYHDFYVNNDLGPTMTTIRLDDYQVGTLIMDCYDAREDNLIFQCLKTKTIQEKSSKREKTIPKAVAKLMKKFPVKEAK